MNHYPLPALEGNLQQSWKDVQVLLLPPSLYLSVSVSPPTTSATHSTLLSGPVTHQVLYMKNVPGAFVSPGRSLTENAPQTLLSLKQTLLQHQPPAL
jgi:hypothetical protein